MAWGCSKAAFELIFLFLLFPSYNIRTFFELRLVFLYTDVQHMLVREFLQVFLAIMSSNWSVDLLMGAICWLVGGSRKISKQFTFGRIA